MHEAAHIGHLGFTMDQLSIKTPYPFQANNSTLGVEHGPDIF